MAQETETTIATETAPVKFGLGQITNPTPKVAKNVFRVVLYTAALINLVLQVIVEIPEPVRIMVGKYSIYAVTLVHSISKLFGIDISDVTPSSGNPVMDRNSIKF